MKIPTILALALIIIAVFLGVFIYFANQKNTQPLSTGLFPPKNIAVVNISSTQASVIWQTASSTTGLLSWGATDSLGSSQNDVRDTEDPTAHLFHLVTLSNLSPSTTYYFEIRSDLSFFPNKPLTFKTTSASTTTDNINNKAIFGVILDSKLNPVDEALVVLKTDQTADLATVTTSAGNFLLPLVDLKTKDLSSNFVITDKLPATLLVYYKDTVNPVQFTLPLDNKPLPKIILGQDNNFTELTATFSAELNNTNSPASQIKNPFDLNGDGVVNAYDLSIILAHFGESPADKNFLSSADLNHDGIINQADVDIEKKALR